MASNFTGNVCALYQSLPDSTNASYHQVMEGEDKTLPPGSWYRYPTWLRLVKIRDIASHSSRDDIECTLETFELSEAPPYRCLSYVWGSPRSQQIQVNGHPLKITRNLHRALERIRAGAKNAKEYLWIDMISINQDDLEERSAQVSIMGSIFAQATQVIGWLGWEWDKLGDGSGDGQNHELKHEAPTEAAIAYIQQLAPAYRRWKSNAGGPQAAQLNRRAFDDPEMHTILGLRPAGEGTWKSVVAFLQRKWFERAWIVQEVALARTLVLVCGSKVLPWQDVVDFCSFLDASGWTYRLTALAHGRLEGICMRPDGRPLLLSALHETCQSRDQILPRLSGLVRDSREDGTLSSDSDIMAIFEWLIVYTRPQGATEPRDKIYAPLALLRQACQMFDPNLPSQIISVDYKQSLKEVYTQGAILCLESTTDLSFLSCVEDRISGKNVDLPSWVPDFRETERVRLKAVYPFRHTLMVGERRHCAFLWHSHGSLCSLELKAVYFDSIRSFGPDCEETLQKSDMRPWIHFLFDHKGLKYSKGQDIIEVCWRSLIIDWDGNENPAKPDVAFSFKRWLQFITARGIHGLVFNPRLQKYTDWSSWVCFDDLRQAMDSDIALEAIPSTDELAAFLESWRCILIDGPHRISELRALTAPAESFGHLNAYLYPQRRFFVSEAGFMGLAPASTQKGDQLWFLSGAEVPFILRPKMVEDGVKCFELVGEAYVHGLMSGEILHFQPNPVAEKIVLV